MWAYRLEKELRSSSSAFFVTLTYSEEYVPQSCYLRDELRKKDLQDFFKRLRKANIEPGIKYYAVGEYGTKTERPHYHIILFNTKIEIVQRLSDEYLWPLGNIKVGDVNSKTINYVTKYVINRDAFDYGEREKPFACISKGIGKEHYELNKKLIDSEDYVRNGSGHKLPTPRYYRDFKNENRWLAEINYAKKQVRRTENERNEVDRLRRLGHQKPYEYIDERALHRDAKIKNKGDQGQSL